jgi:hypothetical protein
MGVAREYAVINTWAISIGRPDGKRSVEGDAMNEEIILNVVLNKQAEGPGTVG